ncbi:hypothetical protein MMC31_005052 [Peltigera leucophlebia]|nr:hypothetical protein [Peltigera leucophlebia]
MSAAASLVRSITQFTAEEDPLNLQGSNQDLALLPDPFGNQDTTIPTTSSPHPDSNTAFLDDLNMNLPPVLHRFFPPNLEEFDPITGILMWFREPQPPECDEGKFAFCCNQGPPTGRRTNPIEAESRRRKCSRWSHTLPGCYFTANQFCCDCKDNNGIAYACYNPIYRDNSDFNRLPVPNPHSIPTKPRPITPNPEPSIYTIPPERRSLDQLPNLQGFTSDNDNNGQMLYAAVGDSDSNPTEEGEGEEEGKKAGRGRMEDTCTDEYLIERGVKPKKNRYYFKVDD